MTIPELYQYFLAHPSVTTDTRKIKPGDIFFALSGPNHNGNDFIAAALEQGASLCVGDDKSLIGNEKVMIVEDALTALQELASMHRTSFTIPFIAITGSNGKTTTKELMHAVLSKKYRCYTTVGNLNNHIGVPLTILAVKTDAEIAIVEMGANHQKEIEGYCKYARPDYGLINNVGKAHLEGFGGVEGIKKGKGELYDFIAANEGTAFINADYEYLHEMASRVKKQISYGTSKGKYQGHAISTEGILVLTMTEGAHIKQIKTNLVGDYNLPNTLAAICVGKTFGLSDEDIKEALETYEPGNSRSQFVTIGTNKIILDAYNANPSSMKAAVENFAKTTAAKKIIYLGAMKEMGEHTKEEHEQLVALLKQHNWAEVVLVGKEFEGLTRSYKYFETTAEARDWYLQQQYEQSYILIKGSRGMAMEKLLD